MLPFKNRFIKILICTIPLILVLQSCVTETECNEALSVSLTVGLKTIKDNKIETLTVDSLWVNGLNNTNYLLANGKNVSKFDAILKNTQAKTEFLIRFNTLKDTLTVLYTTNPAYFISLECGCIATHTIDEVVTTHHFIDSVRIVNRSITQQKTEHVQIFHN